MIQKLSFEIEQNPVLYQVNGKLFADNSHKVISRSDNQHVLSVMKSSYTPMLCEDFSETTRRMQEISGFKFEGYSEIDGGSILISHLKNDLEDFKIGGHKIDDYLIIGNSFDGRYSFFIGTTTVLLRCSNQFSRIRQVEKVRNTKSAPKRREELMKALEIYFQNRRAMYKDFDKMLTYKIDDRIRKEATDYILRVTQEERLEGMSTRKLKILDTLDMCIDKEISDLGKNLWSLFNGVTRYTTHELNSRSCEVAFGNMFGHANELNGRAYQFAKELIK